MAGVKKKDIPDIAAFMPEFWEFVKSVWIPEDSDQYWKEVCDKEIRQGRRKNSEEINNRI